MIDEARRTTDAIGRRTFLKSTLAGTAAVMASSVLQLRFANAQDVRPLVWGSTVDVSLDPHTQLNVPAFFIKVNVYDSLYEYRLKDGIPEAIPVLATQVDASEGGAVWDVMLRDDANFHDGSPVEAEDVVYSFQRLVGLRAGAAPIFSTFIDPDGITAVSPTHVRFQLKQPYGPFIATLPLVPIVNKELVESHTVDGDWGRKWLATNAAGSGPYKPIDGTFVPQQKLDLEWNPDYFRGWPQEEPMKLVYMRYLAENSVQYLALEKGEIDATHSYVPPDQFQRFHDAANVTLSIEPTLRTYLIRMHNQRPPFDNLDYRKAISCAFPYELFIDKVLLGNADRNGGPIPKQLWGNPDDLEAYPFDLEKAKEHLERARAAGAPVDREIEYVALVGLDETVQTAQLLQSQLRRLGIKMKISRLLWANVVASTQKMETSPDIWAHWATSYYVDPDNFVGTFYAKATHGSQRGSSWYDNPEVDAMIVKARSLQDQAEREPLYEEISRRLVAEAVDIWIYNGKVNRGVRNRLKGYEPPGVGDGVDLRTMWVEADG